MKCQRAGEECVYAPRSRKTKTDLVESMEMLQERLGMFFNLSYARCVIARFWFERTNGL